MIFKRSQAFLLSQNALSEGVIEFILNIVFITLQLYSKLERNFKFDHYRRYLQ